MSLLTWIVLFCLLGVVLNNLATQYTELGHCYKKVMMAAVGGDPAAPDA